MTLHPLRLRFKADLTFSILQRVLVLCGLFYVSKTAFNLQTFPGMRDGEGYLHLAEGIIRGTFAGVPPEDTQYFIGYPFFLSFFLHFLPAWAGIYLFQFLCIAGSFFVGHRLFETPWITRWLTFCIPSYVLFTSMNMSESLIIFLIFAAVYAYKLEKYVLCSLAIGCALITRPQSMCFLHLLLLAGLIKKRRYGKLLPMILFPALFLAGMHYFNYTVFGDALHNYRLYGSHESGGILSIPFQGYLHYSNDVTIRLANRIYIWLFTGFTALGLFLFWQLSKRRTLSLTEKIFFYWGSVQLFFFLSLNSRWGFMELPRYFIPVLPSVLMGYYEKVPKTWLWVIIFGTLSIAFSIYAEGSGNRYAH